MLLNDPQRDMDFWILWEDNKKLFFRKCLALMKGDICEAEDALSTAMLKAREKMIQYRGSIRNFKGWALRLTENVCLDQLRRSRRLIRYDDSPEAMALMEDDSGNFFVQSSETFHSRESVIKEIFEMVHQLPSRLREPVLLRFLFSESYRDIAGRLHITEANARKRIQEARSALKLRYGEKINRMFTAFSDDGGIEPESPLMKKIIDDARSVLDGCGFELEFPCKTAWILDDGAGGQILVFLPLKPCWHEKGFDSFLNYLSRHPGGWKRQFDLAQLLYAAGIRDQSELMLRSVLKKNSRSYSALILLGNMLGESGRADEAEMLFRQAGSLVYRDSSRQYLAGMAAMCRGDRNEAVRSLGRAASLEPSNVSFSHARGICLFRSKQYAEALRLFEEILAANPGDIVSLAYCCELSIMLGRLQDAGKYVDCILEFNPYDYFGLTRKAGLDSGFRGSGKKERTRLQRIAERFEQLARIINGSKIEKFTDGNTRTSINHNTDRKGGEDAARGKGGCP